MVTHGIFSINNPLNHPYLLYMSTVCKDCKFNLMLKETLAANQERSEGVSLPPSKPGGWDSNMKQTGMLVGNFEFSP